MGNADWIEANLSNEQKLVIEEEASNISILASAGSGKTRTLVHLLARDLTNGIPAKGIVAFTFTEKAAEELSARIHMILKQNAPRVLNVHDCSRSSVWAGNTIFTLLLVIRSVNTWFADILCYSSLRA
jgi:superfamily I DNA/RNA helicase